MKAKALIRFKDLKSGKTIDKGSIFEVTKERLKELNNTSYGVIAVEVPGKDVDKNE